MVCSTYCGYYKHSLTVYAVYKAPSMAHSANAVRQQSHPDFYILVSPNVYRIEL